MENQRRYQTLAYRLVSVSVMAFLKPLVIIPFVFWLAFGRLVSLPQAYAQGPEGDEQVTSSNQVYLPLIFATGSTSGGDPDVEVSPAAFEATLAWRATVTRTLTIANNGSGVLEFELSELGGQFTPMQAAAASYGEVPLTPEEKVEAKVWDELAAASDGKTEFLVLFQEQADLGPAFAMRDWSARGEFVLRSLRETAEASQAAALAQVEDLAQRGEASQVRPHYIINALLVRGSAEVVNAVAAQPEVAAVRAVRQFPLPQPIPGQARPATLDGVEWNIAQIGADQVWREFGVRGEGIVVANIDSGVHYTHQALVSQYRGNQGGDRFDHNYNWWDPNMDYLQPTDDYGHGTHTMGTMIGDDGGGQQIGVAPEAQWIAAQGCDYGWCWESDLISAAEWILAPWDLTGDRSTADPSKRPHVVNNSWGGYGGNDWYMSHVDAWRAAGIFPAFSIGNDGELGCGAGASPGDYPQSFATGATGREDVIAFFSSRGPSSFGGIKPDVSAPGVDVRSASNSNDGGYFTASGTSMASPHSAGLVALMWSANAGLVGQVEETVRLINESALAIADASCGAAGPPNNAYGWGRIDAYHAISQVTGDVSWLVAEAETNRVQAHNVLSITVTLDATSVSQPGTYQATITISSNDPDRPHVNVPVTMTVLPDSNMGQIRGSVTSDRPGGALQGALVEVVIGGASVISGTTGASGDYGSWWLMDGSYDVTVTADGYLPDVQNLIISPGLTSTHDVMLTLDAPQIQVMPTALDVRLPEGWMSSETMTVRNVGVAPLTFEITETNRALSGASLSAQPEPSGRAHVVQKNKEDRPDAKPPGLRPMAAGGPDLFGYTFTDSDEAGGPRYEWVEIASPAGGAGIEIPLTGVDDGYYWPLALPFSFNFYGTDYTSLAVASNGTLYFEDGYIGYGNGPIPGPSGYGVDRFIAHFWDDLVIYPGAVYYLVEADRVIIEYYQVSGFGGSGWGTWQVILFANGNLLFQYQDVTFDGYRDYGRWATVGIQGDTLTGLQYSYAAPALSEGLAICFAYPGQPADCSIYSDVPWLSENPPSGILLPDESLPVEVIIDAGDLAPGVYSPTLVILSNDPHQGQVSVPVTVTVDACQTSLLIDPPDAEGYLVAGPFTVSAVISDVTDLGGFEFELGYDPALVHVEDVSLAPFPGSTGRSVYPLGPVIDNGSGMASFGAFSVGQSPGPSGTGNLAVVTLSPQSVGAGVLDLRRAQVADTRGEAVIACSLGSQVTVSECHLADFDCDCDVDIEDVMAVADRWGCEIGATCYDATYDMDGDGDIDSIDIMQVAAYWGWTCAEASSFEPQAGAWPASAASVRLAPADTTVEADQPFTVEVWLDGAENLGGFEFELGYDPAVVQVESVDLGSFLGSTGRDAYPLGPEVDHVAGSVRFGGFSVGEAPGAGWHGALATVNFLAQQDGDPGLKLHDVRLTGVGGRPQPIAFGEDGM
jgi:subtilisin family serine protease